MNKTEIAKTLFKAKQLLEDEGWCRGFLYDHFSGQRCMMGALNKVEYGHYMGNGKHHGGEAVSDASKYLTSFIKQRFGVHSIPEWNNDHAESTEHVLAIMDKAASQACEEGKHDQD